MSVKITPLDNWIASRIAAPGINQPGDPDLKQYQLFMLKKTLELAMKNSPFYQAHLKNVNLEDLKSIEDIRRLPFIFPRDLADHGLQMLCVSQSEIARVTTLQTSGTTACPKRIFFTEKDLELTRDFFSHGMQTLVKPGETVMVLMPGSNFGSVGERVEAGLNQIGCHSFIQGFVDDPRKVLEKMERVGVDCIIGLPVQVLCLARISRAMAQVRIISPDKTIFQGQTMAIGQTITGSPVSRNIVKSVLLTGDHVPLSIVRAIKEIWDCPVFIHYGMTETGLGGGVECQARQGCHLREADLFFEIVDKNGEPLPPGKEGKITITTLTRTGMPLIRYRTGDRACFLKEPCPCGSNLKRLGRVKGRSVVRLGKKEIRLDEMDEALFSLDEIIDFQVTLVQKKEQKREQENVQKKVLQNQTNLLNLEFWSIPDQSGLLESKIRQALYEIPAIKQLVDQGNLIINNISPCSRKLFSPPEKRRIKRE